MNRLYALLVYNLPYSLEGNYYGKLYKPVLHTDKSLNIKNILLSKVPLSKVPMVACHMCWMSLLTEFGPDIKKLDPVNTYFSTGRREETAFGDTEDSLYGIAGPSLERALKVFLDQDIKDRLVLPLWHEVAAAGCLQMLRYSL